MPLASRMAAEGVVVDAAAANLAAGRWLREVANARQHATTGAVPAERLAEERAALRGIPAPYGGIVPATLRRPPRAVRPILGTQPPAGGVRRPAGAARERGMSELQHARIAELCGELRLGAMADLYGATAQVAAARDASFRDFLEDTLRAEREVRRSRARGRLWLPRLSITTISPARRSGTSSNQQSAPSLCLER